MKLHLIDTNPALVNAWFDAFADFQEVEIQHGDLLKVTYGCIVAPTMVMPEMVESLHCQRAMRAVLRMARQHPNLCSHIFCPGLATGVGQVPPQAAAAEMAQAYREWIAST